MNAIDSLWNLTWAASVHGSVLILVAIGARALFRRHVPAQCFHLLWIFVALRLLIPFAPETRWSAFNFLRWPHPAEQIAETASWRVNPAGSEQREDALQQSDDVPAPDDTPISKPSRLSLTERIERALPSLWLAGAVLQLTMLAWSAGAARRNLRRASPITDARVQAIFAQCCETYGWSRSLPIIEVRNLSGPAVLGLWRPVLLLPAGLSERLSDGDLRFIFLHEIAHLKRRDLVCLWLATLVRCLHWFNPLAWPAMRLTRIDMELACDETVLRMAHDTAPEAYGQALLNLVRIIPWSQPRLPMAGILEGKRAFQKRIREIARRQPVTSRRMVAAAALLAIVGLAFGANETPQPNSAATDQAAPANAAPAPIPPAAGTKAMDDKEAIVRHIDGTKSPLPQPPAPTSGATFANGWKVVSAHSGAPATMQRADGSTISLSEGESTSDGIKREKTAVIDVNKYAIVLRKDAEVVWLNWPNGDTKDASAGHTFADGGRIVKMTIRITEDKSRAKAVFRDSYGRQFEFDSAPGAVGKIVSYELLTTGHWWKVVLQRGEQKASLYVNTSLVERRDSKDSLIQISSQFVEVPAKIAASLDIPGSPLHVPIRENAEERSVSLRPYSSIILQSEQQHSKFLALLLNRTQGVDVLSTPRVTTKSRQRAVVEIIRELRYPTAWKLDEIRRGVWQPSKFETRNLGITLEVEPKWNKPGSVSVDVTPQIDAFLGWVDQDNGKAYPAGMDSGKRMEVEINPVLPKLPADPLTHRLRYVFSARKGHATANLHPGETLVLAGINEAEETKPFPSEAGNRSLLVMIQAFALDDQGDRE